jgi:hypothetical protein
VNEPVLPQGQADESAEAFFGADTIASGVIAALIKQYGPKSAEAVYKAIKGDDVVFFRIFASWQDSEGYCIRLGLENLLPHGVYIENIRTVTPDDLPMKVLKDNMGLGENNGDQGRLFEPILLPPYGPAGASKTVWLRIQDPALKLQNKSHVKLQFKLVRLDEVIDVDKETKSLTVRIRHLDNFSGSS